MRSRVDVLEVSDFTLEIVEAPLEVVFGLFGVVKSLPELLLYRY